MQFRSIIASAYSAIRGHKDVQRDAAITNLRRLFYASVVAVPVSVAHIVIFSCFTPVEDGVGHLWRDGIIFAHMFLATFMTVLAVSSVIVRRKKGRLYVWASIIQYVAITSVMAVGVAIVTIDQLVTPSITPFLVACTMVALVFLIPPLATIPLYLAAYAVYYHSLGLTQQDEAVLLSNQVNGITAIGIGIVLSSILWQNYSKSFYLQKELAYLAACDSLTGLRNRREFRRIVDHELARMRRHGYDSCVLITDIDHFKRVNDEYGHPAGDELLRQFAASIKGHLRETDIAARWGGEEFIMLLPMTASNEGLVIAERLRKAIEQTDFPADGRTIRITASFGVAELSYDDDETFSKSYTRADKALYKAKESGRNCVVLADAGDNERSRVVSN